MDDAERGEIVADHRHHAVDRGRAHQRQPFSFRHHEQGVAMRLGEVLADSDEIIAGIQTLRDG